MSLKEKIIPEIYEIENIQEKIAEFPPFYERGFTKRYCAEFSKNDFYLDTCISMFSNKVCLLFLADGHSIIKEKKTIKFLDFKVGKEDRLTNTVGGKYKRNAQHLQNNSVICFIETTDGMKYPFCAGLVGKLININSVILTDHTKIVECFNTTGFIAMVQPKNFRDQPQSILKELLTRQEYDSILSSRN